jgi:hypothetical protein
MAMVAWACLCYTAMWLYFARVNARRARGEEDHKIEGLSDDEIAEMGDDSPRFVYTI